MILIYSPHITERLKYINNFIFSDVLNIAFNITTNKTEFESSALPRINYSDTKIEGTVQIIPHELLFENDIKSYNIQISEWLDTKVFFQTNQEADVSFDIFAASFYLLTRYEEYLPYEKDKYGRFQAEESLAYRNNFLEEPVVDQWAFQLANVLKNNYSDFKLSKRKYRYIPTVDIDIAYAYKYKGFGRTIGALIKSLIHLNFSDNLKRTKVLLGLEKDPFDTYKQFEKLHEKNNLKPIFFFLVGHYAQFDKNHSLKKPQFQKLIKNISSKTDVGIHPSYHSNSDFETLKSEVEGLSQLINKKVEKSRQHFLKLAIPETYRNLNKLGILEDYTMGFASSPGFRAGTCTPFHFYDLEKEEQTLLKIFPFQVMDGTLNEYLTLNQREALETIRKIANAVKRVNGTFITLWHNESVGEQRNWSGWSGVYEEMIKICKP